MPLSRFEERITSTAEVLDFLTRVFLEKFKIQESVKIEWILHAFNKVFIWDFNASFY